MIEVNGGQIRISGSHQLLGAELALAIAGVKEYLLGEESEPFALSTVSVSRVRADRKRLKDLIEDAAEAAANEYKKADA